MIIPGPSAVSPPSAVFYVAAGKLPTHHRRVLSPIPRLFLALGLALLPLLIADLCFARSYRFQDDAPDDAVMEMLAQGVGFSDEPTPHLMYINIILGRVLVCLYTQLPGVPWYSVLMQGIQLLSTTVVVYLFLGGGFAIPRLVALGAYLFSFDLAWYIRPQYTLTAAAAAQAAVVLWLWRAERRQLLRIPGLLLLAFLVFLAALVRYEACFLAFMVIAPVVVWMGLRTLLARDPSDHQRRLWHGLKRCCLQIGVPLAIAGSLVVTCKSYNERVYAQTPGWEDFYKFNWLRSWFTDWHRAAYTPRTESVFEEVGWSRNDYELLHWWFFPDAEVYSIDHLERALAGLRRLETEEEAETGTTQPLFSEQERAELFSRLKHNLRNGAVCRLFMGVLLLQFFLLRKRLSALIQVLLTAIAIVGLSWFFITYMNRFPMRIAEPMLALLSVVMLALPIKEELGAWGTGNPTYAVRLALVSLLSLLAVDACQDITTISNHFANEHESALDLIDSLDAQPDELYMLSAWPGFKALTPADIARRPNLKILGPWYLLRTPINEDRLSKFGIHDMRGMLYNNSRCLFVAEEYFCKMLVIYLREHYGLRTALADRTAADPEEEPPPGNRHRVGVFWFKPENTLASDLVVAISKYGSPYCRCLEYLGRTDIWLRLAGILTPDNDSAIHGGATNTAGPRRRGHPTKESSPAPPPSR